MKADAMLHFVTHTHERVEFCTRGFVEKADSEVRFGYDESEYSVVGILRGGTLTVTRSGESGYEMVFASGKTHKTEIGGMVAELRTDKLLTSVSEHKLHISVSYVFGGAPMQMILHAEYD